MDRYDRVGVPWGRRAKESYDGKRLRATDLSGLIPSYLSERKIPLCNFKMVILPESQNSLEQAVRRKVQVLDYEKIYPVLI